MPGANGLGSRTSQTSRLSSLAPALHGSPGGTGCPSPLPFHPRRWLRLQGTLKEHHEALQLALEVAAFLQQADTLLGAIHAKVPAMEPGSAWCEAVVWPERNWVGSISISSPAWGLLWSQHPQPGARGESWEMEPGVRRGARAASVALQRAFLLELRAGPRPPPTADCSFFLQQRSVCSVGKPGEGEPCRDRDVRDIASQVMVSARLCLVL